MAQYTLSQDISELQHALLSYLPVKINLSAFSLGHRKGMTGKVLQKDELQSLELVVNENWTFTVKGEEFVTIHPDKHHNFKLEYQDEHFRRLYRYLGGSHPDYFSDPNDLNMPQVNYSTFRCVVDDYLLEVFFHGKIPLEEDGELWKIVK
ncbi:MAG: hypothetical protein U9R08_04830 [Nanoarchaeota archaeon]|nr:hypothetical protein [Nanoarchaeota archaeon]